MITKTRPNEPNTTFTYVSGRLTDVNDRRTVSEGGGITKYKYDCMGRISEVNDIYKKVVKYEYDNLGLRTKLTYPDDSNVTYEYDALNRLTKVKYNGVSVAEYGYDELSRRTLLKYGNDANIVYQYDIGNRLTKLTNNINSTTAIPFDYANYDKVGNRKSMKTADANTQVYNYDKLYQLLFVDYNDGNSTSYGYDKLGNRTLVNNGSQTAYQSNRLNQYVKVGDVNYYNDANGNVYSDGGHIYYYDCENRLRQSISPYMYYYYDFAGRRVRKLKQDLLSPVSTRFTYDGQQIIADYNGGNLIRKYVYGPGIDEPICMIDVAHGNAVYYYHFDGLGSVVALSNSSGQVVEKYRYDVYGKPEIRNANNEIRTTSDVNNRYMFTGREYDSETGLYYYRARYYHPTIGRFMQADPIGYVAGLNFYSYVENNPVNSYDPRGLRSMPSPWPGYPPIDLGPPPSPSCRAVAQEEAAKYGEKYKHNNSMRHCVTSCSIAKRAGKGCAFEAGWAHELWPGNWSTFSDAMEDLGNNATGRGCSDDVGPCEKNKYKSCEDCCAARGPLN